MTFPFPTGTTDINISNNGTTVETSGVELTIPVKNFLQPFVVVKTKGNQYVDVLDISCEQNCNWGFKNERTQALLNTVYFTVPNTDGSAPQSFTKYDTVEIWGDYLEPWEIRQNETIENTTNGTIRTAKLIFTGYIQNLIPKSDFGGNVLQLECRNTIFKLQKIYALPFTYRGRFKDAFYFFTDQEKLYQLAKIDVSNLATLNITVNIGSKTSVLTGLEKFRVAGAHIGYVDETDTFQLIPFEYLYNVQGRTYYSLAYGENILSADYVSENLRVNKVVVYYMRTASKTAIATDDFNISQNEGKVNTLNIISRDTSTYSDALKLAQSELRSIQMESSPIRIKLPFFPYIKVLNMINVKDLFLNIDDTNGQYFTVTKISHLFNVSGATTTIEAIASNINGLSDAVLKSRRINALGTT